ncbi:hypothetical protein L600_004800000090 [Isoptericola variabilis J7]|nr:hypothetical protein L600_004800000090 [Isoptericola variabilis J7]
MLEEVADGVHRVELAPVSGTGRPTSRAWS